MMMENIKSKRLNETNYFILCICFYNVIVEDNNSFSYLVHLQDKTVLPFQACWKFRFVEL